MNWRNLRFVTVATLVVAAFLIVLHAHKGNKELSGEQGNQFNYQLI